MTAGAEERRIRARSISLAFGKVVALRNVDVDVEVGRVMALLGQNGSGKSTLVKVLTGVYTPDSGSLCVWGDEVKFPITAKAHGIGVVHQDLGVIDEMSAFDNIAVAAGFDQLAITPVRTKRLREQFEALAKQLGLELDLGALVRDMDAEQRALVAILRALHVVESTSGCRLLILDEVTDAISEKDSLKLFGIAKRLAATTDTAVLVITHRLSRALEHCDDVTVLRDGEVVLRDHCANVSVATLADSMLGRPLLSFYPDKVEVPHDAEVAIEIDQLSGKVLSRLSLVGRRGDIVGVTGLPGMGQQEVVAFLAGLKKPTSGGFRISPRSPGTRPSTGIVPADRLREGCWVEGSAQENVTLPIIKRFRVRGLLRHRAERAKVQDWMGRLGVRPSDPSLSMGSFSGGNQQKLVFARALQREADVLILDEPTQGVDAGARRDLLDVVTSLASEGVFVLIASNDYEQLAAVCNRVLVLVHGRVTTELIGDGVSEAAMIRASNPMSAA
jgi:ribose transport system ATP-binding protein